MLFSYSDYEESAAYLRARLNGFVPEVLLILGSGLGALGDQVENATRIPYGDVPHFRTSSAPMHAGQFVFGTLRGRRVAVMQGRLHCYEGYTPEEVAYPVRVVRLLGAKVLFVTNASGCVNSSWQAGDLMLIADHICFGGMTPLRGENLDGFGTRFPDTSALYTPRLRAVAKACAASLGIPLREGVYFSFAGPQFETPAEVRAARTLGADTIGMSTIPEVLAAVHCGMEILGVSLLSNMATGILPQPLSIEEVEAAGKAAAPRFSALVLSCLESSEL